MVKNTEKKGKWIPTRQEKNWEIQKLVYKEMYSSYC